jgi:hypothetical protein
VGKWLQHQPSNEAVYLAERYLQSITDLMTLKEIIRGAASHPRQCRRLFKSIEILLERYPSGHWDRLQAPDVTNKTVDKLILRWLELNRSNPVLTFDVSIVAVFSDSYVVLKAILNWMVESSGNDDRHAWFVYGNLTYGDTETRTKLMPQILSACRSWILAHPRADGVGRIVGNLIYRTCSEDDVRFGLNWYNANRDTKEAPLALTAILNCARKANVDLDATVLSEAKDIVRGHERDHIRLVNALLKLQPDVDFVETALKAYREKAESGMLTGLLRTTPNEILVDDAYKQLSRTRELGDEFSLYLALLKADPRLDRIEAAVKRWLRKRRVRGSSYVEPLRTAFRERLSRESPSINQTNH